MSAQSHRSQCAIHKREERVCAFCVHVCVCVSTAVRGAAIVTSSYIDDCCSFPFPMLQHGYGSARSLCALWYALFGNAAEWL